MMRTKLAVIAFPALPFRRSAWAGRFALGGSALGDTVLSISAISASRVATLSRSRPPSRQPHLGLGRQWRPRRGGRGPPIPLIRRAAATSSWSRAIRASSPMSMVRDGVVGMDCRARHFVSQQDRAHEVTLPGRRTSGPLTSRQRRHAAGRRVAARSRLDVEGSGNIDADAKTGA